jgi:hydrophobe/amphiphile efflux-1 (HAE1) family protein
MNFSKTFIDRPIATSLVMAAILLAGILGFTQLPLAALPRVDFPTVSVSASLPGADPTTMAATVAAPLERQFAQIAGLAQMTSVNTLGNTSVTLQFDLDRNIDSATQDIQSAINAAGGQLPKNLPNPPTYRKTNPADAPILIIGVYSDALPIDQVDDYTDNMLVQQISQLSGVGQVLIFGEQKPAVRVQIDPTAIASQGLSLEDVRNTLALTSVNAPKGSFNGPHLSSTIDSNDQILKAKDWRNVVIAYRNGAPVHVSDVGDAIDSVENNQIAAWADQHRGIVVGVFRQPGANVIETADTVKAELPRLQLAIPKSVKVEVMQDRTLMIRASVHDVEMTMLITIALVVMVIFLFLRKLWATVIPAISVPLSLVGTFGVMYLFGYSLDNLSLMALTIAVGFVVDDAIVMIENIVRYIEQGDSAYEAAVKGAGQIGFTIISITVSLIAVFIPLLLMGGIVGRLFHEFAVTVSMAVLISGFVSLTLTPTMCARFLGRHEEQHGRFYMALERFFAWVVDGYAGMLRIVLRHQLATLCVFFATLALTIVLFGLMPKGFFPQQDTGLLYASTEAAQDVSFDEMVRKQEEAAAIIRADPAMGTIPSALGSGGGNTTNTGRMFMSLKPFDQRSASADEVIDRLGPKLAALKGFQVHLQARQDITVGGRLSRTQYQYTLQDADSGELSHWASVMLEKMKTLPQLQDVATDEQLSGLRTMVNVDRETASRLGITSQQIDDTLYDAFGQRQVATIYTDLNQYHVVLEVDPKDQVDPNALDRIYVKSITGAQVPLGAFTKIEHTTGPLSVSHQGQFPAVTLSFNLSPGVALGDAVSLIERNRDVPGQRPGVPVIAGDDALSDPGGAGRGLYRAGRAVRKLYPPPDHSIDLAVGGGWRAADADAVRLSARHDGADRHHPPDRHRQEERDHDDRFRAGGGTPSASAGGRGDLSGGAAAVPADHDDDDGGPVRRPAADARDWRRVGIPPPAGRRHRRRPAGVAGADPVHHAGGLSLSGPFQRLAARRPADQPSRRAAGAGIADAVAGRGRIAVFRRRSTA